MLGLHNWFLSVLKLFTSRHPYWNISPLLETQSLRSHPRSTELEWTFKLDLQVIPSHISLYSEMQAMSSPGDSFARASASPPASSCISKKPCRESLASS